jgi:hypothetical protein
MFKSGQFDDDRGLRSTVLQGLMTEMEAPIGGGQMKLARIQLAPFFHVMTRS